jgi:transcriptional regulator with XRE-family HTH domain
MRLLTAAPHRRHDTGRNHQAQLAERLKTDQGNVARLERGRSIATLRTLQRIAAATGHTLTVDFVPTSKK